MLHFQGLVRAKWTVKLTRSFKIPLQKEEILKCQKIAFRKGQLEKLKRFVKFVVYLYVLCWFTSPISSDAPLNDFQFFKSLSQYCEIDLIAANSAMKAFRKHLSYLTEEMIP